jgi:hypothetical protein
LLSNSLYGPLKRLIIDLQTHCGSTLQKSLLINKPIEHLGAKNIRRRERLSRGACGVSGLRNASTKVGFEYHLRIHNSHYALNQRTFMRIWGGFRVGDRLIKKEAKYKELKEELTSTTAYRRAPQVPSIKLR